MAFCPECGKSVSANDASCAGCGRKLQRDETHGRAQRFNGTMMMASPMRAKAAEPANANAHAQAEDDAVSAAAGTTSPRLGVAAANRHSHRPPGASARPTSTGARSASPGSTGPARPKGMMLGAHVAVGAQKTPSGSAPMKATMLGPALAPTTPRNKPPGAATGKRDSGAPNPPLAAHIHAHVPARSGSSSQHPAQSVQALRSMPVHGSPPSRPVVAEPARAGTTAATAQDGELVAEVVEAVVDTSAAQRAATTQREYLPGDPMAPQPIAAKRPRPQHPTHRLDGQGQDFEPGYDGNYVTLYWAICIAVVLAVGALAFRLL